MKADQIIAALAIMRQRMMKIDCHYDAETVADHLRIIAIMRDYARSADVKGFSMYVQRTLAGRDGDAMCYLLDELWEELDVPKVPDGTAQHVATWETFEQAFL